MSNLSDDEKMKRGEREGPFWPIDSSNGPSPEIQSPKMKQFNMIITRYHICYLHLNDMYVCLSSLRGEVIFEGVLGSGNWFHLGGSDWTEGRILQHNKKQ